MIVLLNIYIALGYIRIFYALLCKQNTEIDKDNLLSGPSLNDENSYTRYCGLESGYNWFPATSFLLNFTATTLLSILFLFFMSVYSILLQSHAPALHATKRRKIKSLGV